MSQTDPVVRFCPRCGGKAKASAEIFSNPQPCPTCKASVLFWDVAKEPNGELLEAVNLKPLIAQKAIPILLAVAVGLALVVLLLLIIGLIGVPLTLAILFLIAGGYCIAIFLAQQYNIGIQANQLSVLMVAIESTRDQQANIAIKYTALKDNFQTLVGNATKAADESKARFESELKAIKQEYQEKTNGLSIEYTEKAKTLKIDYDSRVKSIEQSAEAKIANATMQAIQRETDARTTVRAIEQSAEAKIANATMQAIQRETDARTTVRTIAVKYLAETQKQLISKLNSENLTQNQDKFLKAVEFCRKVGFDLPPAEIQSFQEEIKKEYTAAVRKQLAREEQARIKEQLREEAKAEADFNREMKRLEQEEKLIERLLAEARSKATAETSAQIEELERRLAEAKEKERALSMAQQTKAGNVYVISNIGSFGENVFKIGMTRRLEPMDRIKELGDASVPFPFDVHMMIACDNAPNMENELHKRFNNNRLNKVNFRKEFFAVSIEDVKKAVEKLHGEVEYVAEPEALQYRESLTMTEEQFALVTEISAQEGLDLEDDDRD